MSRMQEIFDTVVTHLRKQGIQAMSSEHPEEAACMYMAPDGRKCAAGCLIPIEDYQISFEGNRVHLGGVNAVSKYFGDRFSAEEILFISHLQEIHDESDPLEWEWLFAQTAKDRNLTLPEPIQ